MEWHFTSERNTALPLYRQLSHELRRQIAEKGLKPGDMLPSVKLLAAAGKVSLRTMDMAIGELIDGGVCYRRPKKGTFVGCIPLNEDTEIRRHKLIAVYSWSPADLKRNMVQHPINCGIEQEAGLHKVDILRLTGDLGASVDELWTNQGMDLLGIVVMYCPNPAALLQLAHRYPDLRFVLTNYRFPGSEYTPDNFCGVFSEEFAGGYLMTDYLIRKGYRRIAVISVATTVDSNYEERVAGWRGAMRDHGLSAPDEWVEKVVPDRNPDVRMIGKRGMESLLARGTFDAVFGLNDIFTAGAFEYLRLNGKLGQMELAGFDNYIPEISQSYSFATIAVDYENMGRLAVRQLLNRDNRAKTVRIAPTLIPRTPANVDPFQNNPKE